MGDGRLRDYIWGILIFTLFIVGGTSMMGIMQSHDSTYATDEKYTQFNDSFNRLSEVTTAVEGLQTGITEAETDFGAFGVLNALISSSWQSLKLMFSSFSLMNAAFDGLTVVFGVPAWVAGLITLAVIVLIAFIIYSAIFQSQL